jgi:hypothetical protein
MRATLLDPADPIDLDQPEPTAFADCVADLGLAAVISAAAAGDSEVAAVVTWALAHPLTDPEAIRCRQAVLADFVAHPALLDELLQACDEAVAVQRAVFRAYFMVTEHPDASVRRSVHVLHDVMPYLHRLRDVVDEYGSRIESQGLRALFEQVNRDLTTARLEALASDVEALRFVDGVLVDASLGPGATVHDYRLRRSPQRRLARRLADRGAARNVVLAWGTTDDGREITAMRDHALLAVATDLDQASRHLVSFLTQLRLQLRLFRGALNLDRAMSAHQLPRCVPQPRPIDTTAVDLRGLVDLGMALRTGKPVVGNDFVAPDGRAIVITGPNNGGKSTFLRSVGQAQLLMQAGFTVPADRIELRVTDGVLTHFRRGEDQTMTSGKLAEEMQRMSALLDQVRPNSTVLFNESFATTYELEGTRIAANVVKALLEAGVTVVYVTHMYALAEWFSESFPDTAALVAQRAEDGTRTFRVIPGEHTRSSYGLELYDSIVRPPS